jgi:hypothetical protein
MYSSTILDLGTSWRWGFSFTPLPLYPWVPGTHWIGGWVGPRAGIENQRTCWRSASPPFSGLNNKLIKAWVISAWYLRHVAFFLGLFFGREDGGGIFLQSHSNDLSDNKESHPKTPYYDLFVWHNFRTWRWRLYISPKYLSTFTVQHLSHPGRQKPILQPLTHYSSAFLQVRENSRHINPSRHTRLRHFTSLAWQMSCVSLCVASVL